MGLEHLSSPISGIYYLGTAASKMFFNRRMSIDFFISVYSGNFIMARAPGRSAEATGPARTASMVEINHRQTHDTARCGRRGNIDHEMPLAIVQQMPAVLDADAAR